MEVITEFTPLFFTIFIVLGIICAGIVSVIIFKKIQNYKLYRTSKNYHLNMDIDKIENVFNETLRHLDDLENFMIQSPLEIWKMELEISSIRGKIRHQLGHIPRIRSYLN